MSRLSLRLCIGFFILLGLGISWQQQRAKREREASLAKKAAEEAQVKKEMEDLAKKQAAEAMLKKLHGDLAAKLAAAATADAAFVEAEHTRLKNQLSQLQLDAEAEAAKAAQDITRMRALAGLLICMAKDQINGTHTADEQLEEALAAYSAKLAQMEAATERSITSTQYELNARTNTLAGEMLASIQQVQSQIDPAGASAQDSLQPVFNQVKKESLGAGVTFAVLPFDLLLLKSYLKAPLGKMLARAATVPATNAALAVADGPLPVGEVAAILLDAGFAAWTAWEIYDLSVKFPADCQAQLKTGAQKHGETLSTQAHTQGQEMLRQMQETRKAGLATMLAEK